MYDEAGPNLEPNEKMVDELEAGAVFGEPISEGGMTVVPVAEVRFAFGYGSGWGRSDKLEGDPRIDDDGGGGGSGAGGLASAKGYIRISAMRSGLNQCWTLRELRWPASPSRPGASSGLAERFALLAREVEGTRRAS